ncbi:helicase RepA family protein [Burkholderia vietnamiensis]|uniref:helicase RepA family protein n=1 Tax=Burkholderia vietnamiensis TaxID=60552 RepID=UPI001FC802AE|nr:helicase RepA family protein [Burkholderia vietnamiensis]
MTAKTSVTDQAARTAGPESAPATKADKLPLNIVFADELPDTYEAPDELVQGLLTVGGGSVLYGDSNSGKTFFAIALAAAVALGVDWMGRRTEQGLVVYLAAESPQSVRSRVQAYKKYHGVSLPDFAVVQNSLNLFADDADTQAIIKAVKMIEAQRNQKVRLIIGDTLARLSAGANENAGQDMGLVIERFDRIRRECDAHFMLVHHSGKNTAAGARGWSGVRAAVDVEIEVTDQAAGRCAEVTKDRDLGSKGERIGFRLDSVEMGRSKWGASVSTCIVAPAAAPERRDSKKLGPVEGAITEFLREQKGGTKKSEVAAHFKDRYQKASVYRAMKNLVATRHIHEADGVVSTVEHST